MINLFKRIFVFIICALMAGGCSSNEFESSSLLNEKTNNIYQKNKETCEVPLSKYTLNTDIVSLRIKSKNNINFGFNAFSNWFKFFETSFKTKEGELRLEMNINDALDQSKILAHGSGASLMKQKEFSFSFGIDLFGIDFKKFSQTPLAELTRRSLYSGLNDLISLCRETLKV